MVDAEHGPEALARLSRCLTYWQGLGCKYVALPWLAPSRYTDATKPPFVTTADPATPYGNLLASGEQAFLMLADRGALGDVGGFVGWTPCFREEAPFDDTHHFYFTKVEVFVRCAAGEAPQVLESLVAQAQAWMQQELTLAGNSGAEISTEQVTSDQIDLVLNGLEVGSYGVRQFGGFTYVYGTGCAEPRFTAALARGGTTLVLSGGLR